MTETETPKVWVGCLGCYNGGNLIGEWFDATDAPTETGGEEGFDARVKIPRSHVAEGHEELWVMDHEGFGGLLTGEFSPSEGVRIADIIEQLNEGELVPYAAWRSRIGATDPIGEDVDEFRGHYHGKWASEEAYCEEFLAETERLNAIPEDLRQYFDLNRYTRDFFMEGHSSHRTDDGDIYVFSD